MTEKILVIKLGALGDVILALGSMEAIRKHHKDAHVTLLTTRPFVDLAQRSGYFNDIIVDSRPAFWDVAGWHGLFRRLNGGGFSRVYDLQANDRTGIYRRLFLKKPEWIAAADKSLHAFTRAEVALEAAGIDMALPDLSWMASDVSLFAPPAPYMLLVPGSAPSRPEKRWPAQRYAALAQKLAREGYHVAALGTAVEAGMIGSIARLCPELLDLSGQTSLYDIATLARGAAGAVGNDTGPMHLIAAAGCTCVVLFNTASSDPALSAPVGRDVRVLAAEGMEQLSVADVFKGLTDGT